MASLQKYCNDKNVMYELNHNFRTNPKPSSNIEIDSELSENNILVSPESHGTNTTECMDYYHRLLDKTYIYGKDSNREISRSLEWVIQAPADLALEQHQEFFNAVYEYLNKIFDEKNVICACQHVDEITKNSDGKRISKDHLHYMVVPRTENPRYVTAVEKFYNGLSKLDENGIHLEKQEIKNVASIVNSFYKEGISKNETIREITKQTSCKYEDARKIFNAVVRKESETYKMKLNSEAFTSMKQMHEFHPRLQQFLDSRGIKCTVSYKSQGINRDVSYTIEEAKTVTRSTGLSIEKIKSLEIENQKLQEQVKALSKELEISREREIDSSWGSNYDWEKDIELEF